MDIGEVSLTASISQVMLEVMLSVVARDVALTDHIGELVAGHARQFGGFAEWENFLGVQSNCEFNKQMIFNFWNRKPDAACYRFRDREMKGHESCFLGATPSQPYCTASHPAQLAGMPYTEGQSVVTKTWKPARSAESINCRLRVPPTRAPAPLPRYGPQGTGQGLAVSRYRKESAFAFVHAVDLLIARGFFQRPRHKRHEAVDLFARNRKLFDDFVDAHPGFKVFK